MPAGGGARPRVLLAAGLLAGLAMLLASAGPAAAQEPAPPATQPSVAISVEASGESATLMYFNRPIVALRARIMGRSPMERAAMGVRVMDRLVATGQIGPVTITPTEGGLFLNVDSHVITGLTPTDLADAEDLQTAASAAVDGIRLALAEATETRRAGVWLRGGFLTLGAMLLSGLLLVSIGRTRRAAVARLTALAGKAVARSGLADQYSDQASTVLNIFQRRLVMVVTAGLQLAILYPFLTFALRRFPYTRPWGESLRESMFGTLASVALGILHGIPSLFTVFVIVIIARAVTLLLEPWFAAIERGAVTVPWMHAETAPTTRRLVNIAIWLFAGAMAFPYIPGSNTDAFRGISVAVGLMFTLGSSGLVNQLMSGLVVTYSRALRPGDYVRIATWRGRSRTSAFCPRRSEPSAPRKSPFRTPSSSRRRPPASRAIRRRS